MHKLSLTLIVGVLALTLLPGRVGARPNLHRAPQLLERNGWSESPSYVDQGSPRSSLWNRIGWRHWFSGPSSE